MLEMSKAPPEISTTITGRSQEASKTAAFWLVGGNDLNHFSRIKVHFC